MSASLLSALTIAETFLFSLERIIGIRGAMYLIRSLIQVVRTILFDFCAVLGDHELHSYSNFYPFWLEKIGWR